MVSPSSVRSGLIGALSVTSLVVLILSAHVNTFMGFFYVADRFPFVMSVITITLIGLICIFQFVSRRTPLARPIVEVVGLAALLLAWTGANAFSTIRWKEITPQACRSIGGSASPSFLNGAKVWCNEIQALRALIWINMAFVAVAFWSLLGYCIVQTMRGSGNIWWTPLSVFEGSASMWKSDKGVFNQFSFESQVEQSIYPFDMRANTNLSSSVKRTLTNDSIRSDARSNPYTISKGKGRATTPTPDPVPEIVILSDGEGPSNGYSVSRQPSTYPY